MYIIISISKYVYTFTMKRRVKESATIKGFIHLELPSPSFVLNCNFYKWPTIDEYKVDVKSKWIDESEIITALNKQVNPS